MWEEWRSVMKSFKIRYRFTISQSIGWQLINQSIHRSKMQKHQRKIKDNKAIDTANHHSSAAAVVEFVQASPPMKGGESEEGGGREAVWEFWMEGRARRCCLTAEPIPTIVIGLIGRYWFYATGRSTIRKLLTDWPVVIQQSTRWPLLDYTDHLPTEFRINGLN